MVVTLDNFMEEATGELDWYRVNETTEQYASDVISTVDALLYLSGRMTAQANAKGWSSAALNALASRSGIVSTYMQFCLIDDSRVLADPVVAERGKPVYTQNRLQLLKTKTFDAGVVILYYLPRQQAHKQAGKQLPIES